MAPEGQRGRRSSRSRRTVRSGLRVVVNNGGRERLSPGLATWLTNTAPRTARGLVSIAFVSDDRIRTLNRRYRRKDYATDVLSFPFTQRTQRRGRTQRSPRVGSKPPASKRSQRVPVRGAVFSASSENVFLGDIVIAAGVARRQAREAGHPLITEIKVLALHGLLHLLGYDHERDTGQMRRLEWRLRRKGGLREGLIERGQGGG
jgi:probable rRNA maturation factor